MRVELIAFSRRGEALAAHLAGLLGGAGYDAACTRAQGQRVEDWTAQAFPRAGGLIFVGAAGIAVRAVAPHLRHKSVDPAVVVVDEAGRFAVPILSGHLGGANDLARELARLAGATAVITTATDCRGVFSPDQWARRQGLAVVNPEKILPLSAKLLAGETVTYWSQWPVAGRTPTGLRSAPREEAELVVGLLPPQGRALHVCPKTVRLGVGCRRGTPCKSIRQLVDELLKREGLPQACLGAVCTLDRKGDEPGLLQFCAQLRLPLELYTPQQLRAVPGDFTPSPFVESVTGVDNVCERAAAAGGGRLLVGKTARDGVTLALALDRPNLDWRWLT